MEITTIQLNDLFVHNNVTKLWGFVLGDSTKGYKIEDFVKYCIKNSFDEKEIIFHYYEGSVIYYYLEEPNSIILEKIQNDVTNFFIRIMEVKESSFDDILENYKDWYKKNIGITPQVKDFFLYLVNSDNNIFNEENLKKYLAEHVFYEESKIIENYQQAKDKQQTLIDITPQQTLSIEPKEKPINEKSIYDLPDDFEVEDFDQSLTWNDDAQFSVPRILNEGEESFWAYNNIAELKGIGGESFICEIEIQYESEKEDFKFNCTSEGIEKESDGTEDPFKSWLRISDKKYIDFIAEPIYNSFHDTYRTGLENAIGKKFEGWNFGKFALNILFCDFVEPQEKGEDTYYKIVPKYSGVPDLQLFVEEELRFIAEDYSYVPLDTIPYFFKYHFDKSKNVIEFLRNAIKTTNNAWGTTPLSILCKNSFNEWLEHIIKEYRLDREEIFRQPTISATLEEGKEVDVGNSEYKKPSIRAVALYYYFLITQRIELSFDDKEVGKTKAIKNVTDDWKIDNREFWKEWKKINVREKRIVIDHYKDYNMAIQLLNKNKSRNNDAIALAKSEKKIFAPKG